MFLTLQADCPDSKAATAAETHDPEQFDIPDHETITRRKQFRMKAVQKQKRAERKQQREIQKAEKEAAKQTKAEAKQAKAAAKQAKLDEKAAAKEGKNGKKSKAAKKSDKEKKDNEEPKEQKPQQGQETDVHETMMDAPVTPSPLPKDKSPLQTPVKHVKSRKLKKLRKLESLLKEAKSPVNTVVACHEEDFENPEVAQKSSKVSKKTGKKAGKKTQNNDAGATHEGSKGDDTHEDCTPRGKKRKAGKTNMPVEKGPAPKKNKKSSEAPAPKAAPKAAPKRKKANEEQPDEEVKAQVEKVLRWWLHAQHLPKT